MLPSTRALVVSGLVLAAALASVPAVAQVDEWLLESLDEASADEAYQRLNELSGLSLPQLEERCDDLRGSLEAEPRRGVDYLVVIACIQACAQVELQAKVEAAEASGSADWKSISEEASSSLLPQLEQLVDRWIGAVGDDPTPYRVRAGLKATPEEREAALRAMVGRFPDDARGNTALASVLAQQGHGQEALGLLESFVAAHPRDPKGLEALVFYTSNHGNRTKAREQVEAWLARQPDDPVALRLLLEIRGQDLSAGDLISIVHRASGQDVSFKDAIALCSTLESLEMTEEAVSCYRSQLGRAREANNRRRLTETAVGLARGLARLGQWDQAREELAAIADPDMALQARIFIAGELSFAKECTGASVLLAGLDPGTIANPDLRQWFTMIRATCGNTDEVAATVADLLQTGSPDELRNQANMLREAERPAQAEEILLGRMRAGEITPALAYELLSDLRSRGGTTDALSYLEAWADADPANPEPPLRLARALRAVDGALDLAIEAQREAIRRAPGRVRHHEELADLLVEAKRTDEARAVAEGVLQDSARLGKDAVSGHHLLAKVALAQGERETAKRELDAYLAATEEPDYLAVGEYVELLRDLGQAEAVGQFLDREYERQVEVSAFPPYGGKDGYLASMYQQADMPEPALSCVERELAASPEDARLHAAKGDLLRRLGRHDEAVVSLREALRLDPSEDGARRDLAEVYLEREQHEAAAAVLEPAVKERGRLDTSLGLLLARAYQEGGKPRPAVPVLERILKEQPEDEDATYALGKARDALGERDQARSAYLRFLELTASYEGQTSSTCTCRCEVLDQRAEVNKRIEQLAATGDTPPPAAEPGAAATLR